VAKKLVIPRFESEEEEVDWYDNHHREVEDEFLRHLREGPIVRAPGPLSIELIDLVRALKRRGIPSVLCTMRPEEVWHLPAMKGGAANRGKKWFALCVQNQRRTASLKLYQIYRWLPDSDAEARGCMRITDESGRGQRFPRRCFLPIQLSGEQQQAVFAGARQAE
jgi:hypothetical protein